MTTYNGGAFIREQMESLINQQNVEIALFVVDDCSHDQTISIINEYTDRCDVKFFQNKNGPYGTGLSIMNFFSRLQEQFISEFEFWAFCDQDDIWMPNKLNRSIECLQESGALLYYSGLYKWQSNKGVIGMIEPKSYSNFSYIFEGGSAGCTYVFRKEILIKLIGRVSSVDLFEIKRISHDWILNSLVRENNSAPFVDSERHILYRIHSSNQYGGRNFSFRSLIKKIGMVKAGFFKEQVRNLVLFSNNSEVERYCRLYLEGYSSAIKLIYFGRSLFSTAYLRWLKLLIVTVLFYDSKK